MPTSSLRPPSLPPPSLGGFTHLGSVPFLAHHRVERYRLHNGLQVLLLPDPAAPVIAFQAWFHVGSRHEPAGQTGIAHLFEHLMFKETAHLPEGAFSRILEEVGSRDFNAWTWCDQTVYTEAVPKQYLELVLKLESDRMAHLVLNERQLESERAVVLNERMLRVEDDPMGRINEALLDLAFEAHPYRWPVIGSREDVENMSLDDCLSFYRSNYSPNNCTLILCGDLDVDATLELIERYYGALDAQPLVRPDPVQEPEQRAMRQAELELQLETEVLQLGIKVPELAHPDRNALHLLDFALLHGKACRLERLLIDGGIASSVEGMVLPFAEPGLYDLAVSLREGHRAEEALAVVQAELASVAREGLSDAELERARRKHKISVFQDLQENANRAQFLGLYESAAGGFERGLEALERMDAVTGEDVRRVAATYLTPERSTVIIARPIVRPHLVEVHAGDVPVLPDSVQALEEAVGEAMADHLLDDELAAPLEEVLEEAIEDVEVLGIDALPLIHLLPDVPPSPWPLVEEALPSGGTLLMVADVSLPLVSLQIIVPGGSGLEPAAREGLTGLTGELLLRGTQKRGRRQFEEATEDLGISLDISADAEHLSIGASGLAESWPELLELLTEALLEPALTEQDLEQLREETLAALQDQRNDDKTLVDFWFSRLVFPDHPYGRSTGGTITGVSAITRADVLAHYRRVIHGTGLLVGVAGAVPMDQVSAGIQTLVQRLEARGADPVDLTPGSHPGAGCLYLIDKPERSQTQILLGHPTLHSAHPDYPLIKLANTAFGGGNSTTRLMTEVREKRGWSYGAFSRFDTERFGGLFSLWVFPANGDALACLELVTDLYEALWAQGITEAELEYARRALLNGAAFDDETPERSLRGELARRWSGRNRAQMIDAIRSAQREDINAALKRHLDPAQLMGAMVCTAGPLEPELRDWARFERIEVIPYTREG